MIPQQIPSYVLLTIKLLSLLGLTVYAIFAGVIVRQEHLMAGVLEESSEAILKFLTIVHFVLAIGLLILAFFIL